MLYAQKPTGIILVKFFMKDRINRSFEYRPYLQTSISMGSIKSFLLKRDVSCNRYADDMMLTAKGKWVSERLLSSSMKYPAEKLKLTVNREKSCTVSIFVIPNFRFPGFALGRCGSGIYV